MLWSKQYCSSNPAMNMLLMIHDSVGSLLGMPDECLPVPGKPRGRLSYTISNDASGAKVEVLLKARAFRIVRVAIMSPTGDLDTSNFIYIYIFISI